MAKQDPIIVLTTCSPGLAQVCLAFADVAVDEAVVLTTPGASLGRMAEHGAALASSLALSRASQIRVLAYEDDPVYGLGARGLKEELEACGIDPAAFGSPDFHIPGLRADARKTILNTVGELVRLHWMPGGLRISAHVVRVDGQCEMLGVQQTMSQRAPEPTRRGAGPRRSPPTVPAPAPMSSIPGEGYVFETLGEAESGQPHHTGPVQREGAVPAESQGAGVLGLFGTSGPIRSSRGAAGDGTGSGPLGGSGPVVISAEVQHGPIVTSGGSVAGALEEAHEDNLLAGKGPTEVAAEISLEPMDGMKSTPPPPPEPPREATVQQRLVAATDTLHDFLLQRCPHHSLVRDMRRKHTSGKHPDAILDDLLELVREYAEDEPQVRAAYGTLEMAQSILDREQQLATLWRVIRGGSR